MRTKCQLFGVILSWRRRICKC